jgi:predicted nucleic acid-binding Zn ribbon protein
MTEDQKTKTCRYCGKSLPVEAIFCYYCQRELVTRPERPDVESKRESNWLQWALVLVVVLIVLFLIMSIR